MLDHSVFNPMSPQANAISNLFILTIIISLLIIVGISGVLVYSLIRYRARPGQQGEPPQTFGIVRLEVAWTIIPFIVVTGLFGATVKAMIDSSPGQISLNGDAARNPNRMTVIGHQWWWEIRYPSGVVTANVVHIPVGQRWVVAVESADVIHDFWATQLGPKIEAVPGQTNYIWLEADKPAVYHGDCAEFCGAGHAWMLFDVVAESQAQFNAWQRQQLRQPVSPRTLQPAAGYTSSEVRAGASLFTYYACASCHYLRGVNGTGTQPSVDYAPNLTHIGSRSLLAAGAVSNTPAHMEQWLLNPDTVKPGVHMPNFQLSEAQARDLSAYLESLR